jgi:hypothetical protein
MAMKEAIGAILAAAAIAAIVVVVSWAVFGAYRGSGHGHGGPGTPPGVTVPGKTTTGSR